MVPAKLHRGTPEEALSVLFIYLFADLPLPPVLAVRTDDTEETSMFFFSTLFVLILHLSKNLIAS